VNWGKPKCSEIKNFNIRDWKSRWFTISRYLSSIFFSRSMFWLRLTYDSDKDHEKEHDSLQIHRYIAEERIFRRHVRGLIEVVFHRGWKCIFYPRCSLFIICLSNVSWFALVTATPKIFLFSSMMNSQHPIDKHRRLLSHASISIPESPVISIFRKLLF